ncbi:hypothetical protein HYV98_00045 [Candidatus Azambacteria bacterium]|nr:hypothetical protein [Candidatus Azambacteria bacterium]
MTPFHRLTTKAQEAFQRSHELAARRNQQQIDTLHLLVSLLEQESIVPAVISKLEVDVRSLRDRAEAELNKFPSVEGNVLFGQVYLTQDLVRVLTRAADEAGELKDEYVSTEHLFLAMFEVESRAKAL